MIIGVSGKIGSGKDTVGSIIQYLVWRTYYMDNVTYHNFPEVSEGHLEMFINSLVPERSDWQIKKYADKLKDIVCILLNCTREQLENRVFKATELGEEWWYFKGRNNTLIPYNKESKRSDEDLIKLTPRLILQLLGTECGRQIIHPNVWVNATMGDYIGNLKENSNYDLGDVLTDIKHLGKPYPPLDYPNWIITDVRFPNEAKAITYKGGINIRLQRELYSYLGDNYTWEELEKEVFKDTGEKIFKSYADEVHLIKSNHESETALDNYKFDYVIDNNYTIEELIERVKEILLIEKII